MTVCNFKYEICCYFLLAPIRLQTLFKHTLVVVLAYEVHQLFYFCQKVSSDILFYRNRKVHSCKIYWLDFMHSDRELIKISVLSKVVFINSIKNIWLVKIFCYIYNILLYLFLLSQHLYIFSFFASFNINIIYVLIYLTYSHCIKRLIVLILKAEFQTKEQEAFKQQSHIFCLCFSLLSKCSNVSVCFYAFSYVVTLNNVCLLHGLSVSWTNIIALLVSLQKANSTSKLLIFNNTITATWKLLCVCYKMFQSDPKNVTTNKRYLKITIY